MERSNLDIDDQTEFYKEVNQEIEDRELKEELVQESDQVIINEDQRVLRRPKQPTKQDRENHLPLHIPFQEWCPPLCSGGGARAPASA